MSSPQTFSVNRRKPASAFCRVLSQFGMIGLPLIFIGLVGFGEFMQIDLRFLAVVFGLFSFVSFFHWLGGWRPLRRASASRRIFHACLLTQIGIVAAFQAGAWLALTTLWPLRATFAISRPALDRLADRVERGDKSVSFPVRAGLLRVEGARPLSWGGVALYMNRDCAGAVRSHRPNYWMCGGYQTPLSDRWAVVQHD